LPKRLRRNFVPAPNFADACLADISPVNDNGAPNLLIEQIMQ
jgi:ATP-dependent helicase HrpA